MKKFNLFSAILFLFTGLNAQIDFIPLDRNPVLDAYYGKAGEKAGKGYDRLLEKSPCNLEKPGTYYVDAGQTLGIALVIDTVDVYPEGGVFLCEGCEDLQFGRAFLSEDADTVYYQADTDVFAGTENVTVRFCNRSDNADCRRNFTFPVVARRKGQTYYRPPLALEAGQVISLEVDPAVLPGVLRCNYLVDCADQYEGREQIAYFTDYSAPDYRLVYRAGRFAGVDSLCVGICDEWAVCDTFRFALRIRQDTLNLGAFPAFMDDFSYAGPKTDGKLWLDNEVFVNNDLAEDPPSIGVATFDGLNHRGRPYGGEPGPADRLTSTYLDLRQAGGDLVLSYWLQRRGLGDRPELADSLILQFKDKDGDWQRITAEGGAPSNQGFSAPEPFQFFAVPIPQAYRYRGFQFRFVNLSDRQGTRDNWNLDYVRISNIHTDSVFNDVAFNQLPGSILENYTAMPWRHFRGTPGNELSDLLRVGVYNHAEEPLNASPSSVELRELETGIDPFGSALTLFNGQEANIPNGMPVARSYRLLEDPTGFPNIWAAYVQTMDGPAFADDASLRFRLRYSLSNTSQINEPGFEAVRRNDQVERLTVFDNYFAYDDGSAETGLVAQEGTQVVVRFTAGVADSLRAVRFMHPRASVDISDQEYRIRIWTGQLDNTPEYQLRLNPFYADAAFDTIQGFTTYVLVDENGDPAPLYLPPGDFFVGWQQLTACDFNQCVSVGFDRNDPQGADFILVNVGQGWVPYNQFLKGALMIRPVVGSETPVATPAEEPIADEPTLHLFPNPTRGLLNIRMTDGLYDPYRYILFDATGRSLLQGPLRAQLDLSALPPGLYHLQVVDTRNRQRLNRRVVIGR